jgi:hypothetical protein
MGAFSRDVRNGIITSMPHAFRIGPLDTADRSIFIYAAFHASGEAEAAQASDDVTGLRMLSEAFSGHELVVEPELGRAGKELGLRRARLPAEVAHDKATMALSLALAMNELIGRDVPPPMVGDLLDAAIAFASAAPWRYVDGDSPLRVEVLEGDKRRTIDGAIMGMGGQEFGVVLYPEPGALQKLLAAAAPERMAERTEILAVSLEAEPAWAAEAIEQTLGRRVVPVPMHMKGRRPRKLDAREVATLIAMLRAASELRPGTRRMRGTSILLPRVEVELEWPEAPDDQPPMFVRSRAKVGRNAPCPCGSGRKYKRCCLAQDEAAERALLESAERLDRFEPDVRLVLEIIALADARFPGWRTALPPTWQALQAVPASDQLLMPLLAYQGPTPAGVPPAMLWARERSTALAPERAEIFAAEHRALLSIWEVLEVRPEVGLELVDLLTGERRFVHEVSGTRGMTVRMALLARVTTVRDRSVLSGLHPWPLPPAASHVVVTAIRRRLRMKAAAIPPFRLGNLGTVEALLDEWHAAHARLDAPQRARALQNTDGEPFEPHEDHFTLARGIKRKDVAAALLALAGAQVDEEGRRKTAITLTKPGNAVHRHWSHTVIGTATIDDRELVVEASSLARLDALRARIEAVLGPRIAHHGRKRMPLGDVPVGVGEGPVQIDAMASLGLWHKPMELVFREHARCVLDEPNDALDGLTPRAAVTKPGSRRALHQWLKELEHAEARGNVPGISIYVREALDLSPLGELVRPDPENRRTGRGRKASETLVDFAAPLLEDLRDPATARPRLELAAMVWNAELLERLLGKQDTSKVIEEIEARADLGELSPWIERLRTRRSAFAEDERIIDVLEVRWEGGDLRVRALARIGPPMAKARKGPKGQGLLFE